MKLTELEKPIVALAPLAGASDRTMRSICREYGADYCVTEMISAKAICFNDKKTEKLAEIGDVERPCGIQLFGSEPEVMASAAKIMQKYNPACIDINMGCPVGKIVSNGEGSALMKNIPLASRIVLAVKKAVGDVPVSVKFRTGFDGEHICAEEFAKAMCCSGADFLCIHGRTREQMYSGAADREIIARVVGVSSVPVFANGDVFTPEDAISMLGYTKASGVMIARGALGNPFIFRQTKELLKSGKYEKISDAERISLAKRHLSMLIADKGEYTGVREGRKHLGYYIKGMAGSAKARLEINGAETEAEMLSALDKLVR